MKANELMIGDWVFYTTPTPSVPVKISKIYVNKTISETNFYGNLGNDCVLDICFEPIPLTQDILEKNGFVVESRENLGHNLQYCILTDGLWIDISGENFFEGKLEYVHQLQHALILCGIDKTIEL